jgi:hypothetical protein
MDEATTIAVKGLESLTDHAIQVVGSGIEIFGILIIVTGIAWSTYVRRPMPEEDSIAPASTALRDASAG